MSDPYGADEAESWPVRQKNTEKRQSSQGVLLAKAPSSRRAWFKTCQFQVTPEIDRALMVKELLVLGVTLI